MPVARRNSSPYENALADESADVLTVSINLECIHRLVIAAWRDDNTLPSGCLMSKRQPF